MGYLRFNFCSQALSHYVDVSIAFPTGRFSYFPPDQPRHHFMPGWPTKPQYQKGMKFQTVYLCQCGEADDTYIFRHMDIEKYATDNCCMVVCPNITNSFGVDTAYGIEYAAFFSEELPYVIQTLFASSEKREDNFIIGCAAGGNGALYNAIRYPDKYAVCADVSGGIGIHFDPDAIVRFHNPTFPIAYTSFAEKEEIKGSKYDITAMTRQHLENGVEMPKMIFIHGSEEGRIGESVKKDAEAAKELGLDTTYICVDGKGHSDEFWNEQFGELFNHLLPLKRDAIYE